MNLLSALPDLKRKKEYTDDHTKTNGIYSHTEEGKRFYDLPGNQGYNVAIDDLAKYELCEESLASILYLEKCDPDSASLTDTDKVMIMEESYREAREILAKIHLWIKRKDVK